MKKIIITIVALTLCISVYPQTVDGPSPVMGGSTQMYTYSGPSINNPVWLCNNCTIVESYGIYVSVTWGNNSNTQGSIAMLDGSTFVASKTVSLLVAPIATAATNIASNSFTANWTTVPAATSYRLDVSTSSSFSSFVSGYNNLTVSGTSQSVTGLTINTTYYYRVRSYSSLGTTGNSNTMSAGTGPTAPTATAATNPDQYSFTANWGSVTGATSYRLDVSTSSSFSTFVTGYSNLTVSGTSQLVEGLPTSAPYYYRVRAVNSSGNPSSNSNTITAVLAPVAQPASSITSTSFFAKWSSVTGSSGYRLDVSTVSNFSSFVSGYNNLTVSGTSQSVTGLSGSTTYYYRVRAVVSSVTSGNSNTALAMDQNYVKEVQVFKEGTKTQIAVDNLMNSERINSVTLFDGLGRPVQQVTVAGSPSQIDVVRPFVYDTIGRERFKYLPYTSSTTGIYKSNPTSAQLTFYTSQANVVHDALPVSETIFDNSPLSRAYEQGGPGLAWKVVKASGISNRQGHTIRSEFGTNDTTVTNKVYLWICDEVNKIPKALSGASKFYPAGRLFRNRTYDENAPNTTGNTNWTEEFTDKEGKVILKRSFDGTNQLNTYYVYDDLGMLRYVIPPLATITTDGSNNAVLASGDLANLCYIYKYDKRQRMVVKKLPGADSVLMVYDLRDRLAATQDGVQRAKSPKEWLFTKYDELNRPILTGTIQSPNTRADMQTAVNGYTGTNLYETRTTSSVLTPQIAGHNLKNKLGLIKFGNNDNRKKKIYT